MAGGRRARTYLGIGEVGHRDARRDGHGRDGLQPQPGGPEVPQLRRAVAAVGRGKAGVRLRGCPEGVTGRGDRYRAEEGHGPG